MIEIGIGANDQRRIAAQFQRHLLHILSSRLEHQLADASRAGEAHRAHTGIFDQGFHGHLRFTQYHVEHTGWQAGLLGQLRQGKGGIGRLVCRFDHHGTTGGQRRGGLAGDHRAGEIPRCEQGTDTDRLFHRTELGTRDMAGNGLAVEPARLFGEPGNEAGGVADLATGFGQRLALFLAEDARQVFLMLQDQLGPAPQQRRAGFQALLAPVGESALGGVHCGYDLLLTKHRHMADHALVGRVVHGNAGALVTVQPVTVDIAQRFEQQGMVEGHGGVSGPMGMGDMLGKSGLAFFPSRAGATAVFSEGSAGTEDFWGARHALTAALG